MIVLRAKCRACPAYLPERLRTSRVVDGRIQCMPLSAAVVNPRSAGRVEGTQSMLGLIGDDVRKLVCRLPRGDCSDQHCGPEAERALCVGLLCMFEYYPYSMQSAPYVSDCFVCSSTILTPSAMDRSPLAAAGFGLTDSQ